MFQIDSAGAKGDGEMSLEHRSVMSWTLQPRRACSGYMYSYGKNTVRPSILELHRAACLFANLRNYLLCPAYLQAVPLLYSKAGVTGLACTA